MTEIDTSTIALVTGANKGLGRETVRRLAALGARVLLGSRDTERGAAAVAELSAGSAGRVELLQIDVTSDESVTAAAKEVAARHGRLDVLVNNAGVVGPQVVALDTTADDVRATMETNTFGPVRVTAAFVPLLRRSAAPRVVMVSSGLGSMTVTADPSRLENSLVSLTYPVSKAALNMITSQYARALPEFRINAVDPGYTATDLNGNHGTQTVQEGTDAVLAMAQVDPDGPTGAFFDRHGAVPW